MSVQLVKGVNLHVIPTEKYKTVRLLVLFNTRLNHETITKRKLLYSMMEYTFLRMQKTV